MKYGYELYGQDDYEIEVKSQKYLKIFDRNHNILDEIDTYNNDLQYGWTLSDIDTASFSIGLENNKCTEENMLQRNHIEI